MTEFRRLAIPEIVEVVTPRHGDDRGFFSEIFKEAEFAAQGIAINWIQDNLSFSAAPGTVRGLHFQAPPVAQHKLVRVLRGAVLDVAVDIRRGSPTYGRWVGCELSSAKWNQLLVPVGFAHGFMTLEPNTEVLYKVSAHYSPKHEAALRWNDPAIGIGWPDLDVPLVLSPKDRAAPLLGELSTPFTYGSIEVRA